MAGRWTKDEHRLFLEGLEEHGKEWKKIANLVRSIPLDARGGLCSGTFAHTSAHTFAHTFAHFSVLFPRPRPIRGIPTLTIATLTNYATLLFWHACTDHVTTLLRSKPGQ